MKTRLLFGLLFLIVLTALPVGSVSAQEPSGNKWVLVEISNFAENGAERLLPVGGGEGSFQEGNVDLSGGSITFQEHLVMGGVVRDEYVLEAQFTRPPEELIPGQAINLNISAKVVGGTFSQNGYSFSLIASNDTIDGNVRLGDVNVWIREDDLTPSAKLSFTVPDVHDGELRISVGNAASVVSFVVWVYAAEGTATETKATTKEEVFIGELPGKIAVISGDVEIRRKGETRWVPTKEGDVFNQGDSIRTLEESIVRITFHDGDSLDDDPLAELSVGADTEITVSEFTADEEGTRKGLIDMFRGGIRWLTKKGWFSGSIFSAKMGDSIVGIRGSDVIILHEPNSDTTEIYVNEGDVTLQNTLNGDAREIKAGQLLVVEKGNIQEDQSLSQQEWDSLVKANSFEEMQPPNQAEVDGLSGDGEAKDAGMNWLDIALLVVLAVATFAGLKKGLIKAVLSLAGLIVGVILASNFYESLGSVLGFIPNETAAGIIAFILILITVMIIANILARLLKSVISFAMLGWVNRLGGAAFGLLLGAIFWGAILAVWVKFFGTTLVTESLIAGVLLDKFPLVLALLPGEFDSIRGYFN